VRTSRIVLLLLAIAALGLAGGFVYLASSMITVEQAGQSDAAYRFLAVRTAFG